MVFVGSEVLCRGGNARILVDLIFKVGGEDKTLTLKEISCVVGFVEV